jgi:hypothetical protein
LKLSSEVMIIFPSCRPPPAQIAGHELRNRCQRNAGGRDAAGALGLAAYMAFSGLVPVQQ